MTQSLSAQITEAWARGDMKAVRALEARRDQATLAALEAQDALAELDSGPVDRGAAPVEAVAEQVLTRPIASVATLVSERPRTSQSMQGRGVIVDPQRPAVSRGKVRDPELFMKLSGAVLVAIIAVASIYGWVTTSGLAVMGALMVLVFLGLGVVGSIALMIMGAIDTVRRFRNPSRR